ncbi:hypothetical protein TUMSATVNIG1_59940 (plasmid) [Vibrio nigripulchritudo]|nr:hypothetical protein VNTUMSATTG_59450 [Vibrio nigripulchritudo]BDU35385.1 hypothetical protein TUMSATVNIG1_59940 [Vibrio nigripulchritudo]
MHFYDPDKLKAILKNHTSCPPNHYLKEKRTNLNAVLLDGNDWLKGSNIVVANPGSSAWVRSVIEIADMDITLFAHDFELTPIQISCEFPHFESRFDNVIEPLGKMFHENLDSQIQAGGFTDAAEEFERELLAPINQIKKIRDGAIAKKERSEAGNQSQREVEDAFNNSKSVDTDFMRAVLDQVKICLEKKLSLVSEKEKVDSVISCVLLALNLHWHALQDLRFINENIGTRLRAVDQYTTDLMKLVRIKEKYIQSHSVAGMFDVKVYISFLWQTYFSQGKKPKKTELASKCILPMQYLFSEVFKEEGIELSPLSLLVIEVSLMSGFHHIIPSSSLEQANLISTYNEGLVFFGVRHGLEL